MYVESQDIGSQSLTGEESPSAHLGMCSSATNEALSLGGAVLSTWAWMQQ